VRGKIMALAHGVLRARTFDPAKVNKYISGGLKYRERFF
jgi:hypothetical protein